MSLHNIIYHYISSYIISVYIMNHHHVAVYIIMSHHISWYTIPWHDDTYHESCMISIIFFKPRDAIKGNRIHRFTCKRAQFLNASRGCARRAKPSKTILLPPGSNGDSKDQVGSVQKWGKCSQTEGLGPLHGPKTTWIYMDLHRPTWTYMDLHRPT